LSPIETPSKYLKSHVAEDFQANYGLSFLRFMSRLLLIFIVPSLSYGEWCHMTGGVNEADYIFVPISQIASKSPVDVHQKGKIRSITNTKERVFVEPGLPEINEIVTINTNVGLIHKDSFFDEKVLSELTKPVYVNHKEMEQGVKFGGKITIKEKDAYHYRTQDIGSLLLLRWRSRVKILEFTRPYAEHKNTDLRESYMAKVQIIECGT